MTNKISEQRIMVYCDFSESMKNAIVHGIRISAIFKKELCLFHAYNGKKPDAKQTAQRALAQVIRKLKDDFPSLKVSSLTLQGSLDRTIGQVAEAYDGIMLVLPADRLKPKIGALQVSQIPFLFVGSAEPESLHYDRVMLPVDYRKVMKDTSLWASYFARFNQSGIEALLARESDDENKSMVRKNCKFIEQLLAKFQIEPVVSKSDQSSFGLPFDALTRSQLEDFNLLIIPASQHISLLDLLVGLPETKIIRRAGAIPVLCINPRRDMYILCD